MTDLDEFKALFRMKGVQFELAEKIDRAGSTHIKMGNCRFHFEPDGKYYGFQNEFIILERIRTSESP